MIEKVVATISVIAISTTSVSYYGPSNSNNSMEIILSNKPHTSRIDVNTINPSFLTERSHLLNLLDEFADFNENWNGNGAKPFSNGLISKCKEIISNLSILPEVFPVANNSIQLEYEKNNGALLKFNIFDDKITMFIMFENGEHFSDELPKEDNIIKEVQKFYEGM